MARGIRVKRKDMISRDALCKVLVGRVAELQEELDKCKIACSFGKAVECVFKRQEAQKILNTVRLRDF